MTAGLEYESWYTMRYDYVLTSVYEDNIHTCMMQNRSSGDGGDKRY